MEKRNNKKNENNNNYKKVVLVGVSNEDKRDSSAVVDSEVVVRGEEEEEEVGVGPLPIIISRQLSDGTIETVRQLSGPSVEVLEQASSSLTKTASIKKISHCLLLLTKARRLGVINAIEKDELKRLIIFHGPDEVAKILKKKPGIQQAVKSNFPVGSKLIAEINSAKQDKLIKSSTEISSSSSSTSTILNQVSDSLCHYICKNYSISVKSRDVLRLREAILLGKSCIILSSFDPVVSKLPKLHMNLKPGTSKILNEVNAGGASEKSEALSFEFFSHFLGAQNLVTEMELRYDYPSSIIDYTCTIDDISVGVSVTRAMEYKNPNAFTEEKGTKLLKKKIRGIHNAQKASSDPWEKHILHVWCENLRTAYIVGRCYSNLLIDSNSSSSCGTEEEDSNISELTSKTCVILSVSSNINHVIFSNRPDFEDLSYDPTLWQNIRLGKRRVSSNGS